MFLIANVSFGYQKGHSLFDMELSTVQHILDAYMVLNCKYGKNVNGLLTAKALFQPLLSVKQISRLI